jgi:hypothetical protein
MSGKDCENSLQRPVVDTLCKKSLQSEQGVLHFQNLLHFIADSKFTTNKGEVEVQR